MLCGLSNFFLLYSHKQTIPAHEEHSDLKRENYLLFKIHNGISTMHLIQLLALAAPALAISPVCRGSTKCLGTPGSTQGVKNLVDTINPRDKSFSPGATIACDGNKCAFFNVQGGTAQQASNALQRLIDEGCQHCGEIATTSSHEIEDGNLDVNYNDAPCHGVC